MTTNLFILLGCATILFSFGCASPEMAPDVSGKSQSSDTVISLSALMRASARTGGLREGNIRVTKVRSLEFAIAPSDSLLLYYYGSALKQVAEIKNGERNGVHVEFNENGKLYLTGHVLNNVSDGIWRSYGADGSLQGISFLVNGSEVDNYEAARLDSLLRKNSTYW